MEQQSTARSLSRRAVLGGVAATGAVSGAGIAAGAPTTAAPRPGAVVPLPSPAQVRREFQTMVDFGPRLTGSRGHRRFVQWLEREFVAAGAQLVPCDDYAYERWSVGEFGLEVLDGDAAGPVRVASYYTRSQETPRSGVEGRLVYGGTLPVPSVNGTDLASLTAALEAYPAMLESWATGLLGTLGGLSGVQGSILVLDLPLPLPLTTAVFLPLATYLHWPGHTELDWAQINYDRSWILPGAFAVPLAPFEALGAAGVVFVLDRSFEALDRNYLPFDSGYEPIPALFVDREVGSRLRTIAGRGPQARLTLTAERTEVVCPSVTAVIPGESDETVILDTHTDGQGFVEENGAVAFVQLARHFASLPPGERLKRTLVFSAWPGHMSGALPELEGWMAAHPDLVERAAAALTIEHLGCSEWIDTIDQGYHATGEPEVFGVWTSQGAMFELTKAATIEADLARTALLRPPVQFGVGAAFQMAGVPQIGAIAGPEYLLNVVPDGDMDKLDERLAARQIAWVADIVRRLDDVTAEELRAGDPTLGSFSPGEDASTASLCGPEHRFVADAGGGRALAVSFIGHRAGRAAAAVHVRATGAAVKDVGAVLSRAGRTVARGSAARVSGARRRIALDPAAGRLAPGRYDLALLVAGEVVLERSVRVAGPRS